MAVLGPGEGEDAFPVRAEVEPSWDLGAQHPTLCLGRSLAGDHQHATAFARLRACQEGVELTLRLVLGKAVQIQRRLDGQLAAPEPFGAAPVEPGGGPEA